MAEVNKRLVSYIKKARSQGMNKQTIKQGLKSKGWRDSQIEASWKSAVGLPQQSQTAQQSKMQISQNKKITRKQSQQVSKEKNKNPFQNTGKKQGSGNIKNNQKKQFSQEKKSVGSKKSLENSKTKKPSSSGLFSNPMIKMSVIGVGILVLVGIILLVVLGSGGKMSEEDLDNGKLVSFDEGKNIKFEFEEQEHTATVDSVSGDEVEITIQSDPQTFSLKEGDKKLVNLNGDDYYDLIVQVETISDGKADVYFIKTHSKICTPDWNCSEWGDCVGGTQERTCNDVNECGTIEGKPEEVQNCTVEENVSQINQTQNVSAYENFSQTNQTQNLSVDERMCLDLNGSICNESEYCNASQHDIQNSSIVCCQEECVLNESNNSNDNDTSNVSDNDSSGSCSDLGGYHCNESEYCDLDAGGEILSASDVGVCCNQECEYFNVNDIEIPSQDCDTNYSEFLFTKFESSCTEGESMTCNDKIDASVFLGIGGFFGVEKTGIIVNYTTFYEFLGKNSQGECVMKSTGDDFNVYLHSDYGDFLRGRGTSEEELNEMAEDSQKEVGCYSGKTYIYEGNQYYGSNSYLEGNDPDCSLSFYYGSKIPCVVEEGDSDSFFVSGYTSENNLQIISSDSSIINVTSLGETSGGGNNWTTFQLQGESLGSSNITIEDSGYDNCKMEYEIEVIESSN